MKTSSIGILLAGLFSGAVSAAPISATINDNYWGADGHGYGDVIGGSFFDIAKLQVTITGGALSVKVYTNFKEGDSRSYGFGYGDLFISTNGWNPYGTAANQYRYDDASNGEDWEFVFDTSEGRLYTGAFTTLQSDNLIPSGYIYRNGQEVMRGSGGLLVGAQQPVVHGTESYLGSNINTLEYRMALSDLGVGDGDTLGFKWGMYCANDTIEGAVTLPFTPSGHVPEPASWALLLAGAVGLGFARRKSRQ